MYGDVRLRTTVLLKDKIFTRSLEHKILHRSELVRVVHFGLLNELGLRLVPKNILLQLGVDLVFVHDGHANLEVAVKKLIEFEILEQYDI